MSFLFAWYHVLNIYYINVEWIIFKAVLPTYVLIFNEKKKTMNLKKEQGVVYKRFWREKGKGK